MTLPPLSLLALSALPFIACASSEERPSPTAGAPEPRVARISDTLPADDAPPALVDLTEPTPLPKPETPAKPETAPKPLSEETRKIIEEYKALALKNDCSKGYPKLTGSWRFVGETKTPNYSDNLVIDGTRFKETLSGNPDGRYLSAEIDGEIRCLFKNRVLVQIDKVAPEGAYGNRSGDAYPCDLLSDMDPKVDRMLMICYFDWDLRTAAGLEYEYERVEVKP